MESIAGVLPFGISDLESNASERYREGHVEPLVRSGTVRCCIKGCETWHESPRRGYEPPNAFCETHRIQVRKSTPTYIYRNYLDNLITGHALIQRVEKTENRLGNENSEDALSWNVFAELYRLQELKQVFSLLTGLPCETEPELYAWGNRISEAHVGVWPRLRDMQAELEAGYRIPTEPDIILRVPGVALVIVEAKFGSPNVLADSPEKVAAYLERYRPVPHRPDPLNREWMRNQPCERVYLQLLRNAVYAQWLAEDTEQPFLISLVREADAKPEFAAAVNPEAVTFAIKTWEMLFQLPICHEPRGESLKRYFLTKTYGMKKAFQI